MASGVPGVKGVAAFGRARFSGTLDAPHQVIFWANTVMVIRELNLSFRAKI